ncbi:MAG TPA: phospholipase D-like domain-containing protein [Chakrabartia sp.]|nr:phospholipase D-like domain-containing protein [Chakrabartia sp.]
MAQNSVLKPDETCWQIARADRAHVIVDGDEYFEALRAAMLKAKRRILLIGWDFDTRIMLGRGKRKRHDAPHRLGDFILWLANNRPDLEVRILKWATGAIKMLTRGSTLMTAAKWAMHERIQFKLDSAHPPGCSHHQKIVLIDDCFAVCGGIDCTTDRWDTCDHTGHDARRKRPNGDYYGPWHDATMLIDGEAARALADLGHERWTRAGGEPLDPVTVDSDPWPDTVDPEYRNVQIAIARTRAEWNDAPAINEVEALYLAMIAAARKYIYVENQYFTSRRIAEAIAKRLEAADPPEIVLINPLTADGWLEQKAMDGARIQLIRSLGDKPGSHRFTVYSPVNDADEDIYVHAKLMIVDDQMLRIGSANMNNRSLGLDSECDVLIDVAQPGNEAAEDNIRALRYRLLAEHTGTTAEAVKSALEGGQSMIDYIAACPSTGRRLVRLELGALTEAEKFIADNELLDPDSPEGFFEPLGQRGLFRKRILRQPD